MANRPCCSPVSPLASRCCWIRSWPTHALDGSGTPNARSRDHRADRLRRSSALGRRGTGRRTTRPEEVYCGIGATVGRFLVPMLAAGADPSPSTRRAAAAPPTRPSITALRAQGAAIDGDAFPLVIGASGLSGGEVQVDASVSSQYLSGLLMAAPFSRADTRLRFDTLVGKPYLDLTVNAMQAFGVERRHADAISVTRSSYAAEFPVSPSLDHFVLPCQHHAHRNNRAAPRARSPQNRAGRHRAG